MTGDGTRAMLGRATVGQAIRPRSPAGRRSAIAGALIACLVLGACRTPPPERDAFLAAHPDSLLALEQALAARAPAQVGTLRLALAFGAEADLDLFVTDPLQETVYFANSPSGIGGKLAEDIRCDAGAPRVETVLFEAPIPGRYRISVDFPKRCVAPDDATAPFAVLAEHGPGTTLGATRGAIRPGEFLTIVLEVEIPPTP